VARVIQVAGITARLAAISHREGALDSSRREMTQQVCVLGLKPDIAGVCAWAET